ncbi:hypothetical protein HPO96_17990 [Kribbella sandramycini]|uniref:Uncharacterized protein n=1 Tax=Kribbella sandramycini TaxID=60450 RepID=A0A7Y4P1I1_9ACTN|nr:hypothetical protein [Kribbella sandramycini]MBB6565876.1 hypothetical protein [Kribbella sandramycini]NOL42140.1 hypothetical protein [Kribbella sandramycini]
MPPPDFWTTSAQTMPVLALALVVEARVIVRGWVPGRDRLFKSIQGFLWAFSLLSYAFATPACLRALAGKSVWSGWPLVIEQGIQVGIATLVVAPALELLVRANARAIAQMSPHNLLGYWIAVTSRVRFAPKVRRIRKKMRPLHRWCTATLAKLDTWEAALLQQDESQIRQTKLDKIRALRPEIARLTDLAQDQVRELDAVIVTFRSNMSEFRTRRRVLLAAAEKSLESWAMAQKAMPSDPPDATHASPP